MISTVLAASRSPKPVIDILGATRDHHSELNTIFCQDFRQRRDTMPFFICEMGSGRDRRRRRSYNPLDQERTPSLYEYLLRRFHPAKRKLISQGSSLWALRPQGRIVNFCCRHDPGAGYRKAYTLPIVKSSSELYLNRPLRYLSYS